MITVSVSVRLRSTPFSTLLPPIVRLGLLDNLNWMNIFGNLASRFSVPGNKKELGGEERW